MVSLSVQYIREQPIPFPILNIFKFQYLKVLSTIGLKRYISDSQRNLAFKLFSEHQGGIYINIIVSQEHFLSLNQIAYCLCFMFDIHQKHDCRFFKNTLAHFNKIKYIYRYTHHYHIKNLFAYIYTYLYLYVMYVYK